MEAEAYRCRSLRSLEGGGSALPGSLLFAAGLSGNVLALVLLQRHWRRWRAAEGPRGEAAAEGPRRGGRASAFSLLASALAGTDLLGKCLLSPVVLAAYARNRSLSELWPGAGGAVEGEPAPAGRLCELFAFLLAFFGLAPTVLLLAMALEVCLSLGHPYFYRRHTSRRRGALLTGAGAALCAAVCALPLLGFGSTVQYCPGSWCFMRMAGPGGAPYALLYASLLAALVLAVCACNLRAMRSLYALARRRPAHRTAPAAPHVEELGQLLLLALMTVLFAVCSLPVVVRAYVGAFAPDFDEKADLTALRFFSVNSIVDPWVFIIFRSSLFRTCLHRIARRLSFRRAPHAQLLETWERKESGPLQ